MSDRIIKASEIPLPPLPEQRRIAAILDHADALRAKRRHSLTLLDTLDAALYSASFDDRTGSQVRPLGDLAEVVSGLTKGRRLSGQETRLVPYLAVANVQRGRLELASVKEIEATEAEIERYQLRPGDVVMTEGGDPDKLGRGTVWRGELPLCLHQNHIFRVRPVAGSGIDPTYLESYIASREVRAYFLSSAKQTTGIASINMTQLKALPVRVPASDRQRLFLDQLDSRQALRAAAQRSLDSLDELFASLQSRAFSGQL